MQASILSDPRLLAILFKIDTDLAEETRGKGCPFCSGRLHSARYRRKPRGPVPPGSPYTWRHSFCCSAEDCRRRATPPSALFLGRRVYLGVVVVLAAALSGGLTRRRVERLRGVFGVDQRTLERWREWWQEVFPTTRVWKEACSRFMASAKRVCASWLVAEFGGRTLDGMAKLLRFLAPLSVPHHAP
jgi:hypothetical protein